MLECKFYWINSAEIKKQGTYTFKMKVVAGAASKQLLDTILKKPS